MVDLQTVCCMCGDVGFQDKLFRCSNCHHRFQHSYCSSYRSEYLEPIKVCDWCQSERRRRSTYGGSSQKTASDSGTKQSEYGGDKNKRPDQDYERPVAAKNPGGAPSPRGARRYKLLKDVMC